MPRCRVLLCLCGLLRAVASQTLDSCPEEERVSMLQLKVDVTHAAAEPASGHIEELVARAGALGSAPKIVGSRAPPPVDAGQPAGTFGAGIPKLIHLTWKNWTSLSDEQRRNIDAWQQLNPDFETKFWGDDDVLYFVEKYAPPEHQDMIKEMQLSVTLFDYFRYLLLYKIGGVYSDIDVLPVVPVEEWATPAAEIITGWELRLPEELVGAVTSFVRADMIQQWTIVAAPGHPALNETLWRIFDNFQRQTSAEIFNSNPMSFTGPAVWSDSVLHYCGPAGAARPAAGLVGVGEGQANDCTCSNNGILIHRKERFAFNSHIRDFSEVGESTAKFVTHSYQNSWLDSGILPSLHHALQLSAEQAAEKLYEEFKNAHLMETPSTAQ